MGARRAKEARLPNATGVTSTRKLQKVLTQAAAVYAILLVASGCGQKPLPLDNTGQTEPRVRSVFTETAEADDTTLIVTEPSTVTVIGVEDVGLGETISIEELIAESAELGQNVEAQLDSVLEEVPTDELDQVEAIDGDGFAAVSGDVQVLASAAVLSDPSGSRARPAGVYDRTSIWYDNKSKQMALRIGSSTWGWVHIQKHSVSLAMIQKTTKFPKTRTVSGTTIVYQTPAMKFTCWLTACWVEKSMDVRVVVNTTRLTDGFPKGVITAYCVGSSVCPSWVRQTAG